MTREIVVSDKQAIKLFAEYMKIYADHDKSKEYKKLKTYFDKLSALQAKSQELQKQFEETTKEIQLLQSSEDFMKLFEIHKKVEGKIVDIKQRLVGSLKIEDKGEFEEIQNVIKGKKPNTLTVVLIDLDVRNTEEFRKSYKEKNAKK